LLAALEIFAAYKDHHNAAIVLRSLARLRQESGDDGIVAATAQLLGGSEEDVRALFQTLLEGGETAAEAGAGGE
jgi:hypothetical protein